MKTKMTILAVVAAVSVAGSAMATLIYPSVPELQTSGGPTEEEAVERVVSAFWQEDIDLELLYMDSTAGQGDPIGITTDPGFVSGASQSYDASWGLATRELFAIAVKAGRLWDIYVVGDTEQLTESGETYTLETSSLEGISHVAFYGVVAEAPLSFAPVPVPVSVPDGGTTLILLGLALCVGVLVTTRLKK